MVEGNEKPCPNDYLASPALNEAEDRKKNDCLKLTGKYIILSFFNFHSF